MAHPSLFDEGLKMRVSRYAPHYDLNAAAVTLPRSFLPSMGAEVTFARSLSSGWGSSKWFYTCLDTVFTNRSECYPRAARSALLPCWDSESQVDDSPLLKAFRRKFEQMIKIKPYPVLELCCGPAIFIEISAKSRTRHKGIVGPRVIKGRACPFGTNFG